MKFTIHMINPDTQEAAVPRIVQFSDMALVHLSQEAILEFLRTIAYGHGLPRGWEIDQIAMIQHSRDIDIEVEATVTFKERKYDQVTLDLAKLLKKAATGYYESNRGIDVAPAVFQPAFLLYKEAMKKLKELGL